MTVDTNLASRIDSGAIDEVWVWGGGYFGFDEFAYKIPDDTPMYAPAPYNYWLYDGRKKDLPASDRTYWVMGWIPEVGFDNQVHSFGHRIESALSLSPVGKGKWHRCESGSAYTEFICADLDSPTNASCGDIHYPPNGTSDYDYGNPTTVLSDCHRWDSFPFGSAVPVPVNASTWGGNQEGFLTWWLSYIPNTIGTNRFYGDTMINNWWHYIAFYDGHLADLQPTAIQYDASTLTAGTIVHFDSGVRNAGTVDSENFNVRWLVDGMDVGAYGSHTGVAAETTVLDGNSAFYWTATPGTHTLTFIVDVDDHVDEFEEGRNEISITVDVPEPANLTPTDISFDAGALTIGNTVTFDSGIINTGDFGTGGFNVRWLVDGVDVGAYGYHLGVPANSTVMDGNSAFLWTATPGTHTISFLVDVDGHVDEGDESDNRVDVTFVVAGMPDLLPTTIFYDPSQLTAGNTVEFDSGVTNAGSGGSSAFNVRWRVDGMDVGAVGSHAGVPGGSTVMNGNSAFLWTATPGFHTITFEVDVHGHVTESNEGNNQTSISFFVGFSKF